jgi:hypothetical protein
MGEQRSVNQGDPMTARPSVRTRRLRWSGVLLGTALAAAAVAAPAQAATNPAPTATTVRTLPATGHGTADGHGTGGRGTARANAAVARECNGGTALLAPQWFAVGKGTTGAVVATTGGGATAAAVVDHWTGEVLGCTGEAVSRATRPVDVVGYFTAPAPASAALDVSITRPAAGAPGNDRMDAAQPITALPFSTTVDTAAADADGPDLKDYSRCELSNWAPVQGNTVWYSYRPATTGPAPLISVAPASGWAAGNTHGDWAQQAGVLEVLPGGGTRLVENADDWDCETPVTLTAGATYLIGVYYGWDADNDTVPVSGGPVKLSVTAR